MSTMDEYYYWQKWGKSYDPHKYDYLHAEGPNGGEFEGWEYRQSCLCNACYLWYAIRYFNMKDFAEDYAEFCKLLEKWNGDKQWALNELIK